MSRQPGGWAALFTRKQSGDGAAASIALSFPNQSRSFDSRGDRVRFWAYDQALEVPFFVEAAALCQIEPRASREEASLLDAFDRHRARICAAAAKIYVRHRAGSYTLAAADLVPGTA